MNIVKQILRIQQSASINDSHSRQISIPLAFLPTFSCSIVLINTRFSLTSHISFHFYVPRIHWTRVFVETGQLSITSLSSSMLVTCSISKHFKNITTVALLKWEREKENNPKDNKIPRLMQKRVFLYILALWSWIPLNMIFLLDIGHSSYWLRSCVGRAWCPNVRMGVIYMAWPMKFSLPHPLRRIRSMDDIHNQTRQFAINTPTTISLYMVAFRGA